MYRFDPRTNQSELEVQKIIHLQQIANQLPDAFIDTKRVTKSYIPAENVAARIEIPLDNSKCDIRQKRGRPIGSKDKNPRKKREHDKKVGITEVINTSEEINSSENNIDDKRVEDMNEQITPVEVQVPDNVENIENNEISINYVSTGKRWNRNKTIIDKKFAYAIAIDIINENEDQEPKTIEECRHRKDWPKWRDAIQAELHSLEKREVFGPVVRTPDGVQPVGYKWVFVRKCNEKNEIVRYKARLVAKGFTQKPGIDYEETYSPVLDTITFRFLISLAVSEGLNMHLMDVVTAYLYGSLDSDIYMKVPEGLKVPETYNTKSHGMYSIKLKRSLYELKQSGRMWYNRLNEYLTQKGYHNNPICPCVFIKRSKSGFVIIAVYVDDLNIIGTPEEIESTAAYLKSEFEMKDLGKTKFCLGLQIEHLRNGIFLHQSTYVINVLKRFNMDKAHPLSSPMVVRSLDIKKDCFRPKEDNEEILGPEVPYLSAIGALMYLANNTRPDISFSVNLLARYSSAPTQRHWNGIKHIFRYLRGTTDMGLLYLKTSESKLVGYADAGYMSDPHSPISNWIFIHIW
jgi:hypothetical protein